MKSKGRITYGLALESHICALSRKVITQSFFVFILSDRSAPAIMADEKDVRRGAADIALRWYMPFPKFFIEVLFQRLLALIQVS